MTRKYKTTIAGVILVLIGAALLAAGLTVYFRNKSTQHGAVVSNGYECASIGRSIFDKGGSAVDAAIATLFCEGVAMPQSMGLGGGFLMTIYTRDTQKVETLDAREAAPLAADKYMYDGNSSLSSKGGLSIAVPGELKGYWEAHKRYGKLDWAELVQPTVDLCREGHLVTEYLANMFSSRRSQLLASETLREVFIKPGTSETYKEGEKLKRERLADTLDTIAREGADAIYNGSLTKVLVDDMRKYGSIITEQDFHNYNVVWSDPITISLPHNQTLYSFPPPGSGAVLAVILNILKDFLDLSDVYALKNWQRIVESFKYAYGDRTQLGDPRYVDIQQFVAEMISEEHALKIRDEIWDNRTFDDPQHYGANYSSVEDGGTAHVSVLAPNGDAVSVTSTINLYFGSDIRSPNTGIILNDEMDDFASPNITNDFGLLPSPANYIEPGKRPLSSMTPTIVVNQNGDVRTVIGGAGGSKITTSVALVIIRHLWFDQGLEEAMDEKRLHHQLVPMAVQFESDYDQVIVDGLAKIGHNYTISATDGFAALTAISRVNVDLMAVYDRRRGGNIALVEK